MEQYHGDMSLRSMAVTFFLWGISHITASQFATYCTIASAIITIIVNLNKLRNGKNKY